MEIGYTEKVNKLISISDIGNKVLMAQELDMSRPTLDSRLKGESEWRKLEKNRIDYLCRYKLKSKLRIGE